MTPLATVLAVVVTLSAAPPGKTDDPTLGATAPGQAIADSVKNYTSAEAALIPAGEISKPLQKNDLASTLNFPSDGVVVVSLTGAQLKKAFEISLLTYPDSNIGFLQVSGFDISFNKNSGVDSRVTSVTLNGSKLEDTHHYDVAMPTSLQRGQLGYSNLWDKAKVVHSFDNVTLGSILKGKHSAPSSPRWQAQG
jgi:2',3'-cyclic-nucleotide 2'-phosphodiesterase (5'-nucleotidase family)